MAFEFKLPDIGEGVVEGEIVKWLIKKGEEIREDQPMVEVMTDKATVEIPSPVDGTVMKTVGSEGEVIEVGSVMVIIETDGDAPPQTEEPNAAVPPAPKKARSSSGKTASRAGRPSSGHRVLATPAVRRLAREKGIRLEEVEGTGSGGRITRQDVEQFQAGAPSRPKPEPSGGDEIPYRGVRKKIGDHLVASKRFAPHYTYVEEVDATQLVDVRRQYRRLSPDSQLTYLPFLMKAIVEGLKAFPLMNATLDEDRGVIELRDVYNLGIATATEEGLIVPVVRGVDKKSILELAAELASLSERTRAGKASLEDLRGGTFTITSLGALGGVLATPIINYPEVAILGVHKIEPRARVREGEVVVRQMMNLSLSLDHRVVDGVIGARFMHHIIPFLEHPGMLALGT